MISCARGVSGRSAHRRTLVKSVVFYSAPALRVNLRLLMAALGRLKDIVFIAILQLNGASDPSKHRRPVLKIRCVLTPLQSAAFSMFPGSGGRGGFWQKFDPCARPCAVLVQCLERLVHLDFARGAHCGKQISGTLKPTQPPVHMLWGKGL